jgi:uncharacterized protein (TIGR02001 family)
VKFLTTVAATAFLFWAAPALAQDPAEGFDPNADPTAGETFDASGDAEWSLEGEVGLVTDYRFRGISRTAEQPAAQASATLEHRSGFYAGLWGSTLAGRAGRGDFEVDATLGYRTALGAGTEIDGGLQYQFFPDGDGADYGEAFLSVAHTLRPVTARAGAAYAPEQEALGDEDNVHLFGELVGGIPGSPLTLSALLGYSDGGLAPGAGGYLDWRVGGEVVQGPFRIGLFYIDTDLPSGPNVDSTLILSMRFGF